MILGAGIYQVPLINKAKDLGYYTIVSSIKGNYPGFRIADKSYYCDTTNQEEIYNIALSEQIDAILTTGTDVAIKSIGFVCEKLNLPGITYSQALLLTDKAHMKQQMLDHNISTTPFNLVSDIKQAYDACDKLNYPVVFKATDKSGSRGIYVVHEKNEIESAYNYSMQETNQPYIIVEKFADGYEIGVDAFISDTIEQSLIFPHDKIVYNNGVTNVPIGHIFPINCDQKTNEEIQQLVFNAAKAFGLNNCFVNYDIMIGNSGIHIIELGARCGGTCIPELIERYSGVDYYKFMIENALGNHAVPIQTNNNPCMGVLLFAEKNGYFDKITGYKEYENNNLCISLDYKHGDKISKFINGTNRIGSLIIDIPEKNKAKEFRNQLLSTLKVEVY